MRLKKGLPAEIRDKIFVMARAFQQDYLEQFFSKVRSHGGASRNPDVTRCLTSQHSIELQGTLGFKGARGNTKQVQDRIRTDEPIAKKKKISTKARRSLAFQ